MVTTYSIGCKTLKDGTEVAPYGLFPRTTHPDGRWSISVKPIAVVEDRKLAERIRALLEANPED